MKSCTWSFHRNTPFLLGYRSILHRRSHDFVWGCTFLPKKVDDLLLVVALKDCLNLPQNLSHVAKTVTFCSVFFSSGRLESKPKPVNVSARVMAPNAWNKPRMCLLEFTSKIVTFTPISPQILKILHYKSRFPPQNTHKSWSKRHQNSHRKQSMGHGVSNLGLKFLRKCNSGCFCACAIAN